MRFSLILLFILLALSLGNAQIKTPQPSPFGTVTQLVGITEVSVEYSRPGIKDRVIFGDLVPYGKVWRTGANESTKLKFSTDVKLEGHPVPAGEYSLYTVPGEQDWKIIINKKLDSRENHDESADLLTFKVKSKLVPLPVERFTIQIANMTDNSAQIILLWAQTEVPIKLEIDTDAMVMKSIEDFTNSDNTDNAGAWYSAARYYFSNNKSKDDALDMVNKSLEIDDSPFWVLRLKAEILAALEDYDEAVIFAKRSMVSAQKAGNDFYVQLNQKSIDEWSQK